MWNRIKKYVNLTSLSLTTVAIMAVAPPLWDYYYPTHKVSGKVLGFKEYEAYRGELGFFARGGYALSIEGEDKKVLLSKRKLNGKTLQEGADISLTVKPVFPAFGRSLNATSLDYIN